MCNIINTRAHRDTHQIGTERREERKLTATIRYQSAQHEQNQTNRERKKNETITKLLRN